MFRWRRLLLCSAALASGILTFSCQAAAQLSEGQWAEEGETDAGSDPVDVDGGSDPVDVDAGSAMGDESSVVTNANCYGAGWVGIGLPIQPVHVGCTCYRTTTYEDGTVVTSSWDVSWLDYGDWIPEADASCTDRQADLCAENCAD